MRRKANKIGKQKFISFGLIAILIVGIVFISGCVSDRTYEQPSKVETPTQEETQSEPSTTEPAVKTFKVGETASDGKLAITVNSKSFLDKITYKRTIESMGEKYTSTFDFKPKSGYQFLILDITIENLQSDKTATVSPLLQFKVSDENGYSYDYSLYTAYLDRKWESGDILPGMKKRGNAAFEVPKDAKGLKFSFLFEIGGTTAVFDLE